MPSGAATRFTSRTFRAPSSVEQPIAATVLPPGGQHRINQDDFAPTQILGQAFVIKLRREVSSWRFKPMKPTRALGINCKMESSIPSPARKTGNKTTSRLNRQPCVRASGVRTEIRFDGKRPRRFVNH